MPKLKSEKGSITLFVLVSCLFFIASVTCVHMYMESKQIAVDREYRQINSNYEKNINDTENLDENYYKLLKVKNLSINIEKVTLENNQLLVEFTLNDATNLNVKTIKYGWGTSELIDTVSNWNYLEVDSINNKMVAINNNASTSGDYHLFLIINNKEIYTKITV